MGRAAARFPLLAGKLEQMQAEREKEGGKRRRRERELAAKSPKTAFQFKNAQNPSFLNGLDTFGLWMSPAIVSSRMDLSFQC